MIMWAIGHNDKQELIIRTHGVRDDTAEVLSQIDDEEVEEELHRHEEGSLISNNVDGDDYKEERHLSAF